MEAQVASRLAKLLRMLTSSHDGEVLAAANRINGLVAAHNLDWDAVLTEPQGELSRDEMERIYRAGYERGKEEAAPKGHDWAPAGQARSDELGSDYSRVKKIIDAAMKAIAAGQLSNFEVEFSHSMQERLASWGPNAFVTERQWGVLNRLEIKLSNRGFL